MDQKREYSNVFDISQCLAKYHLEELAECLSPPEKIRICPFILRFGSGHFCINPRKEEIIANTDKLPKEANSDQT